MHHIESARKNLELKTLRPETPDLRQAYDLAFEGLPE